MVRLFLVSLAALVVAAAAAAALPAARASPSSVSWRGVVVAKDGRHQALVTALPGGRVRLVAAPSAFSATAVGSRIVVRAKLMPGGAFSVLSLRRTGATKSAVVRGTVVGVLRGRAIVTAGGSALSVRLRPRGALRTVASVAPAPRRGDVVRLDVRIGSAGALEATNVVVLGTAAREKEGEIEVTGTLTSLTPPTVRTGTGVVVSCLLGQAGIAGPLSVGARVEMTCDLVGGQWQLRRIHGEGAHGGNTGRPTGDGDRNDDQEVEVKGVLVSLSPASVGSVTCVVPQGIDLAGLGFWVGQLVEMKCRAGSGDSLVLDRLESEDHASGSGDDHGNDRGNDDDDDHDDDGAHDNSRSGGGGGGDD